MVGTTKDTLDSLVINPQRITRIVKTDEEALILRNNGQIAHWQSATQSWNEAPEWLSTNGRLRGPPGMMRRNQLLGPVYDTTHHQLVALEPKWPQPRILVGKRDEAWSKVDVAAGPRNTRAMFVHDASNSIMLVAEGGLYQLADEPPPQEEGINIFGLKIPAPSPAAFHKISSGNERDFRGDMLAALDVKRNEVVVYREDVLARYAADEGAKYQQTRRQKIEIENAAAIAASDGAILIVDRKGHIEIYGESLQLEAEFSPMRDTPPRQTLATPAGRWFAVLFENDRLWLFDRQGKKVINRIPLQGSISGMTLTSDDELTMADTLDRVTTLSLPDLEVMERLDPRASTVRRIYRYAVKPLHTVFPKPKDLQNTVHYIMTGKDTIEGPGIQGTVKLDPWQPLTSNLLFCVVMLTMGCIYVYRQDF